MIDKLSYIAGFIDGEGCITIMKQRKQRVKLGPYIYTGYGPVIIIVNSNKEVLTWINESLNNLVNINSNTYCIKGYKMKPESRCGKNGYRLHYGNKNAYILAKILMDYLIIKKEQCRLVIDFYEKTLEPTRQYWKPLNKLEADRREQLYLRAKELNKKGQDENGINNT